MIPGHDEHRNAAIGNSLEWGICLVRDAGMWRRSIEDIAAMHDEIDVARQCRCEGRRIVGEEVESATAAPNARPDRQVEAEMGVAQKQDSDGVRHIYIVWVPVFIR